MNNNKGVTLIELILSIAILGIIISLSFNFIFATINVPEESMDEYDIQHEMRVLSQKLTNIIRESSATFALYRDNDNNLTEKWNYIIPSTDGEEIYEYIWDEDEEDHIKKVLVGQKENVSFKIEYAKNENEDISDDKTYGDKLIEYNIIFNVNGVERNIRSEVEAINSLQVIDKKTGSDLSNTLAYRTDPRPDEVTGSKGVITLILDTSGSMAWDIDGNRYYEYGFNSDEVRLDKVKDETKSLLESFSDDPNIYASLVSFNYLGSEDFPMEQLKTNYEDSPEGSPGLKSTIEGLSANGNTNTGDGLRVGYYSLTDFIENSENKENLKSFMILLVDGETNIYSYKKWHGSRYFHEGKSGSYYYSNQDTTNAKWYTEIIGNMITAYKYPNDVAEDEKESIKVYIIGFNKDTSTINGLNDLASDTGAVKIDDDGNEVQGYYEAESAEELREVFKSIGKSISDGLWQIAGPN